MLAGCSKDEILNHYNNIVQSAGSIELTGKSSLQGEKEKGIDDYTGTYTADYANFSGTEYLFGGTSIKREAGKKLSIDCTLEVTEVPSAYSRMPPSGKVTLIICFYFIGFARGFPRYEMEPPPDFY